MMIKIMLKSTYDALIDRSKRQNKHAVDLAGTLLKAEKRWKASETKSKNKITRLEKDLKHALKNDMPKDKKTGKFTKKKKK